jgi:RecA/RadA recombinase
MTHFNQNDREDFSRFGKSFQEKFVQLLLEDRIFSDQVCEVFDLNFLELKYLRTFAKKIIEYRDKYNRQPNIDTMGTILRSDLEGEQDVVRRQVREYFARIIANGQIADAEFIKDTSLEFCKKQKLKEAILQSVDLLQSSSFDEISCVINDALKLGSDNDFGYDYKVDFEKRFERQIRNPVSTGWAEIDSLVQGGLGRGELGVVIAPTGAGKSMVLCHLGTEAVKLGKTVVHYTLELQDTMVASRYDSCLTGVGLNDLHDFKEHIAEKVKDVSGELIVKEYATKSASVATLRNHIERIRRNGKNTDLIIVDYGDLLRPRKTYKERRTELETIYEELRGMAQEFKCPVWTASQTNRSGLNAEVITMESISEAFNKCFVADFIFTVSRTIAHKNTNSGRFFVAKNRSGPDGLIYPIFMDPAKVRIKVLPPTGETVDEIVVKSIKEQEQSLKDKYKKYRS